MMPEFVVDTSVLIAIFKLEPEASLFEDILIASPWAISTGSVLEARIWLIRNPGLSALDPFPVLLAAPHCQMIAFGPEQEAIATDAYARFGKGQHQAQLNFGDCMAYATAQTMKLPLLFKGTDFSLTDVKRHPDSVS